MNFFNNNNTATVFPDAATIFGLTNAISIAIVFISVVLLLVRFCCPTCFVMNSSKVSWNEDSYDDVGDNYLEEEEVEKIEEVEKTEEEEEVMKTEGEEKVEKIEEVESSLSVNEFTEFKKGDVYQGHSGIVAGTTPNIVEEVKIEEVESSLYVNDFTEFKKGDVITIDKGTYQGHSGIVAGTTPKMVYITIVSDELSGHKVRILRTSIRHKNNELTEFKKGDVITIDKGTYQGHSGIVAGTTPKMVYITVISDELSEDKVRILRTSIRHSMGSNSSTFL